MTGRILTIATATAVTAIAVTGAVGLVALDLVGAPLFEKLWTYISAPSPAPTMTEELKTARDITFFQSVKVEGKRFHITMGVNFATPEDFAAGRQKSRWCYALVQPPGGGMHRQIQLAVQAGRQKPRYTDLTDVPAAELEELGETAESLAEVARKHCVFGKPPRDPEAPGRRYTTIVLKGENAREDES